MRLCLTVAGVRRAAGRGDQAATATWIGSSGVEHHVRSGDEPSHARSPLRLRLGLAVIGLANGLAGIIVFDLLGSAPLMWLFAAIALLAAVNIAVVLRRIAQGPHYQPGPSIPPYRPLDPAPSERTARKPATTRTRRRRYVVLMSLCVLLLILAWTWIRLYSVTAAVAISVAASLIPPFAAVLTNADSPILREDADPRSAGPGEPEDDTEGD